MGGNLDNLKPTDNPRNVATETTNNASFNKEYNSSCQEEQETHFTKLN